MLSLISSAIGFFASGLPKVLEFFQDRADKAHELKLAAMQTERELALAKEGFIAQAKIEEIRTDQIAMQTDAERQGAALEHDKAIMARASTWVVNLNGIVRPAVTFIFVLELVLINIALISWFMFSGEVQSTDDMIKAADVVFSADEMALLSGIISFWFGSRQWGKK
jgi:multidrug resistance efflux pump